MLQASSGQEVPCSVEQEHRIASTKQETNQNNYFCTYDLYGPVHNFFDAGRYITWASGKGLGPGNGEFFGPGEMASSR